MAEYRALRNMDNPGARIHLARLDESRSLCAGVTYDGSPFDEWQAFGDGGPEDVDADADRCLNCWQAWEGEHRKDRERAGAYVPPKRTHKRARGRHESPQVASQRMAARGREKTPKRSHELIRLYRWELEEMGTPEALAELERRREVRKAKRARRAAARVAA
jgi:hypothetical protein